MQSIGRKFLQDTDFSLAFHYFKNLARPILVDTLFKLSYVPMSRGTVAKNTSANRVFFCVAMILVPFEFRKNQVKIIKL